MSTHPEEMKIVQKKYISVISGGKKIVLNRDAVLYVLMVGRNAEIHLTDKQIYETRMSLSQLEEQLGEAFLEIHRGCIVATRAIHSITDKVYLSNGEALIYTLRKKKQIVEQLQEKQRDIIRKFPKEETPDTEEEYRSHYSSFEKFPFAFTDIEMIFNEEHHAVDGSSAMETRHWQNWKRSHWNSCWITRSAACSAIWIPNGFVRMSVQHSMGRPSKSLITAQRSTHI
jgi:hypothetical protein